MLAQQGLLNQSDAGRHVACRAISLVFNVAPLGIFSVEYSLHPNWQRGHGHLYEVTRMVDRLGQRGRKDDQFATVGRRRIATQGRERPVIAIARGLRGHHLFPCREDQNAFRRRRHPATRIKRESLPSFSAVGQLIYSQKGDPKYLKAQRVTFIAEDGCLLRAIVDSNTTLNEL